MTFEINEDELRKTLTIYYKKAYGGEVYPNTIESIIFHIKNNDPFRLTDRCELRLGIPCWRDAKLIISLSDNRDSVQYWFDTNDSGDEKNPNCNPKQNLEYKTKIETAFREANISVRSIN